MLKIRTLFGSLSLVACVALIAGCAAIAPAEESSESSTPAVKIPEKGSSLKPDTGKPDTGKPGTDMPETDDPSVKPEPAPEVTVPSSPTTVPSGGSSGRPGVAVNESLIPAARGGFSSARIIPAEYQTEPGDGSAQFRTNCRFSHMAFDDPIVFPGRSGASHLHIFFGNTGANASSTPESIRTSGDSTCWGGTVNRTAYWAPAVIDTRTGAPVISDSSQSDRDSFLQIYYKTGFEGVLPQTVQNFPVGLRMVAGNAMSTTGQPWIVNYSCSEGSAAPRPSQTSFPNCEPGQLFIMSVLFPQCWDGVNLDSPDHKSHMSYGLGWPDKGCPSTHPVPLAQITQNLRYRVPAGGMATWRLSSDMYSGPAGYSAHADWMNGWDQAVFQRVVDNCYHRGINCRMNLLGDGYELR